MLRLVTVTLLAAATFAAPRGAPSLRLPPIVFVSRAPLPGEPGVVPGLGPHHRRDAAGGRLLVREPDGRIRGVLPEGALFDVSDPSVSPDGRWIAMAGVARAGDPWRLYVCRVAGGGLRPVMSADKAATGFDDLDPCWVASRTLCFASTRGAAASQYADVPATNLFLVDLDDPEPVRITFDRNGAEEPAYDAARRRIVYSRWWYNRYRASRAGAGSDAMFAAEPGITADTAMSVRGDVVNLWQAASIDPVGRDLRLAAGAPRPRRDAMAYQPSVLGNGDVVAVYAAATGLSPYVGAMGIHVLRRDGGAPRRIAGATIDASESAYGSGRGLAAPSACAPAALPDGRVVFAYDAGATGDYGLYVGRPGDDPVYVFDLPGTLELDPAPVVTWTAGASPVAEARALAAAASDTVHSFTFFASNVFAKGPRSNAMDPVQPLPSPLFMRFYRWRPSDSGRADSLELVRVVPVGRDGSVLARGLPADVPMFEQVADREGRPLLTAHGAAHVAGYNFGRPGAVVACSGCHAGHSLLPSPRVPRAAR